MRLISTLITALVLVSGCATQGRRAHDSISSIQAAPGDSFREPASDPGNLPVVDPVAAPTGDHFPGAALPAEAQAARAERPNTLAPGFLLRLGHQEDKDLNGTFRIDFDGKIDLPYNVSFRAQGLTLDEFRQKVAESYRSFFKSGAKISVELVEKAYYIELRGLILKPGKYRVKSDASLDEVISLGGGFPPVADNQPKYLKISRGEGMRMVDLEDYYKSGRVNLAWKGGEILFFQKETMRADPNSVDAGNQVQVLGELKRPGEFPHRPGGDVYFYMAEAGGPTGTVDFARVQIFRGAPGHRTMMEFDLEDPEKVPMVQAGDILMFHADKATRFQKTVGIAANFAAILSAIAVLIIAL